MLLIIKNIFIFLYYLFSVLFNFKDINNLIIFDHKLIYENALFIESLT